MDKQAEKKLPADFVQFYKKFHDDSSYQMAHIQFPLEGYPPQVDSSHLEQGRFYWQKDNWVIHRLENFNDSLYTRQVEQPFNDIVTEVIQQKNTPFGIYRRFYKRGDAWFLIFYSDMNSIKKEE